MSDVTELRCWPCCVRATDWSQDGIIALASDDQVELLFPNTASHDTQDDVVQWRHFALQVPWFTKAELPVKEPAPLQTFSIGEEISSSYTISLFWSPPGLAKHRRCALAVLTSNLVLSIWASEGKYQDQSSWDRRLIVNDALNTYFTTHFKEDESRSASAKKEKIRLRRRVRAFAWAPSTQVSQTAGVIGTQPSWGQHIVAISNDDNQIVFIAIKSPTSTLSEHESWNAEILGYFALDLDPGSTTPDSFTFDEVMGRQTHILNLSWSPWIAHDDGFQSILAYATNLDVRARVIRCSHTNITFGPELVFSNSNLRFEGPMTWSPRLEEDNTLALAMFTTTAVIILIVSATDASIRKSYDHHLDGRWDAISGVAWDLHAKEVTRLHFCSQTTTTRYPTAALELSPAGLIDISTPDWPYWREQISGSQGHFSAHHDLKGKANAKVWGLSSSPLGDFVASCHTVHPTDMIEYGTPNDRRTTIAISNMWGRGRELDFPVAAVSAEAIFSTVRKWVENNVESPDDMSTIRTEIYQKLTAAYHVTRDPHLPNEGANGSYESTDLETLLVTFKQHAFLNPNTLKDRYEILTSRICTPLEGTELARALIAVRLAKELQKLPSTLYSDHNFSFEIFETSRQVIYMIQDLFTQIEPDADAEGEIDPENSTIAQPAPPSTSIFRHISKETCTFCDEPIPFEDLSSAKCTSGHEFTRCGLSFLTIQAPNCTKYCGICNTPFFSDEYVWNECLPESWGPSLSLSPDNDLGPMGMDQEMPDADTKPVAEPSILAQRADGEEEGRPSHLTTQPRDGQMMIDSEADVGQVQALNLMDTGLSVSGCDANAQRSLQTSQRPLRESNKLNGRFQRREIQVTLARVLFLACDVCIYCGGKFVG